MTTTQLQEQITKIKSRPRPNIYTRVTGYYRCVENFNDAKQSEFNDRRSFQIPSFCY